MLLIHAKVLDLQLLVAFQLVVIDGMELGMMENGTEEMRQDVWTPGHQVLKSRILVNQSLLFYRHLFVIENMENPIGQEAGNAQR